MKKIDIHLSTYLFLLFSFFSGYFEYVYLFLLIIFVHESGHYIFSQLVNFKFNKIVLYPFGGITIYNEDLNVNSNLELFVLFGGIIFQLLFLALINVLFNNGFINNNNYEIFTTINFFLISFNFLPIIPLDGGRLIKIILDKIFPYKYSNIISIFISFIFVIIFYFRFKNILSLILCLFLIKSLMLEIININRKYYRFLLERYNNNYDFKKVKFVKSINLFYRDYYHIINGVYETYYLENLFDRKV